MFDSGHGLSTEEQEYNPTPIINEIRRYVEDWRNLPNPIQWQVTALIRSVALPAVAEYQLASTQARVADGA